LASWFRLEFPHLTVGAVASSAPVQATLDFYQYLDVVDSSLDKLTGQWCDANIRSATQQIQSMLLSATGQAQLQTMFQTCTVPKAPKDIATFMSSLMGNWMGTVQYNDEGNNPITIDYLCNIMTNTSNTPMNNYITINNLFLHAQKLQCMDISDKDQVSSLVNTTFAAGAATFRSWIYRTCTEFGYYQTTDDVNNQPFGNLVPLSYYTQLCDDVFGLPFLPRVNDTNSYYGGNEPEGTEVVFVNGSIDPWHALGVTTDRSSTVKAILIQGTAHCANMFPARPQDPPGLARAQSKISDHIGKWLANAK